MQQSIADLEAYLSGVAQLMERYGVVLDLEASAPLVLEESPSGGLSFTLRGFLPDGRVPPLWVLEVREHWRRLASDRVERWAYEFELLDHERGLRRAYHLHDRETFVRRFYVVVHEHCERPIGTAPCAHIAGPPVRDGFHGVDLLLGAWLDPQPPDCASMTCLD